MKAFAVLALASGSVTTPASAQDWQPTAWVREAHSILVGQAENCAPYGFRVLARRDDASMMRRMAEHISVRGSGTLGEWARHSMPLGPDEMLRRRENMVQRGTDAVATAVTDPRRYAEAEALYLAVAREEHTFVLQGCQRSARDTFLGRYYLTGVGSIDGPMSNARGQFTDIVRRDREARQRQRPQSRSVANSPTAQEPQPTIGQLWEIHGVQMRRMQQCAPYGFVVGRTDDVTIPLRLAAHFSSRGSASDQVREWNLLTEPQGTAETNRWRERSVQRANDAVAAAVADPRRYAEAEARYLAATREQHAFVLQGCQRSAQDPFLGRHYVTGAGSIDGPMRSARGEFANRVRRDREARR